MGQMGCLAKVDLELSSSVMIDDGNDAAND